MVRESFVTGFWVIQTWATPAASAFSIIVMIVEPPVVAIETPTRSRRERVIVVFVIFTPFLTLSYNLPTHSL
jgi:hypothetical protein